jgi:4'-phosphopantetheinyl transferase
MWETPPSQNNLARDHVFVWRVPLSVSEGELKLLQALLSMEEVARVARFHRDEDRRRAIVSRGVLRILLSRELNDAPDRIELSYGAQGKPKLRAPSARSLQFNVSHSHEEILVAMTRDRSVGVDIEYVRPAIDDREISERYFTAAESAALLALPDAERPTGFFAYWTCKEAFIKAKGSGLSLPLDEFEVTIDFDREDVPLRILSSEAATDAWSIRRLPASNGYAAAVAAAGSGWALRCWQWTFADSLT